MAGKSGSDSVTGTNASEHLNGGASGDTINGMAGDDRINGGSGNDILDGGSGNDIVNGDAHNDTLVYVVSQNVGSRDVYDGGSDIDTLRLVMTRAEWLSSTFQSDLARYLAFIQTNTLPNGQAKNVAFEFTAFGLSAARFENIQILVDGVLVNPADQAVTLNNDTMIATEDSASASVDVLANDSVPDLISNFSHSQPAHGTVALTYAAGAPGNIDSARFVYTPNATYWQYLAVGQTATDSFTYTVRDADGDVSTATVTVTIVGANDAPRVLAINAGVTHEDAVPLSINLLATATDVDATDDLDVAGVTATSSNAARTLTFTVDAETGAFSLNPAQFNDLAVGESETVTVSYTVTDGNGGNVANTATFVVEGRNDAPVVSAITVAATNEDAAPVVFNLLSTASDVDATDDLDVAGVTATSSNAARTLTFTVDAETGAFSLNPAQFNNLAVGESETVTVSYTVTDGNGGDVANTATFVVEGRNDAPVVSAILAPATHEDAAPIAIALLSTASDVDATDELDVAGVTATSSNGARTLTFTVDAETGAFSLDPAQFNDLAVGQSETITVSYNVVDGNGGVTANTATVVVEGRNDAPVIGVADASGGVSEREPVNGVTAASTPVLPDTEVNDTFATAQLIDRAVLRIATNPNLGDATDPSVTVSGNIATQADQDVFRITLAAGETLTLDIDFAAGFGGAAPATPGYPAGFGLDSFIFIYDAAGNLLNSNDDAPTSSGGTGSIRAQDSYLQFTAAAGGEYFIVVHDWDGTPGVFSVGPYRMQVSVDSQNLQLTDTGSISFTDVDLADSHTVGVTPAAGGYLGALTATVADDSTGDGTGRIDWKFSVANAAVQFLAQGQVLTQSYTVTVDDGHGGVDSQVIEITITGENDQPIISNAFSNAIVVEDVSASTGGAINFGDVDLTDGHSVSFTADGTGYFGTFSAVVANASTGDGSGQVTWSFVVDPATIQFLSEGQGLLQRYIVTIDDGHGGTTQQLINVTLRGTNDAPVITGGVADGQIIEDVQTSAAGVITFADPDANDGHNVSFAPVGQGYSGWFSAYLSAQGQVSWTYSGDWNAMQSMAEGETLTQDYLVSISDGRGGQTQQTVSITITGTNDGPYLTYADSYATVGENQMAAANGALGFFDADLSDSHTVQVTPYAWGGDYVGTLTATLTDAATGDGQGQVAWSFDLGGADVNYLSAGEALYQYYEVTVTDSHGASTTSWVQIQILGENDSVTIRGGDFDGSVLATPVEADAPPPAPIVFTVQQFTGFSTNDFETMRQHAANNAANYTVQANVIDFTDDPGGFSGELPGSNPWPAAVAQGVTGTGGINDQFFARITTTFEVGSADTFTFRTFNDDGVYLLIDGQFVIYDSGYHPEIPFEGSIYLTPGTHTLELFYFEGGGEASLELSVRNSTGQFGLLGGSVGPIGGNALTDTGVIDFGDVDRYDGHSVQVSDNASGYLGALTATLTDDSYYDGAGQVRWSFAVDNAAIAYLGAGESLTQTYTVTIADYNGAQVSQQVTITLNGTNEAPYVTSAVAAGEVVEDGSASVSGAIALRDLDLNDTHSIDVVAGGNGYLGDLSAQLTNALTGDGVGEATWTFSLDQAQAQALAEGEVLTQTYQVRVTDGAGAQVSRTVTITLRGTNDGPVATADSASASEDGPAVTGNVLANDTDVDNGAVLTVSKVNGQSAAVGVQVVLASGATLTVNVDGTYSYNPTGQFESLAVGQTASDSFSYEVTDQFGAVSTATVALTITGANDGPVAVADSRTASENGPAVTGNVLANDSDVDAGDQLSVSQVNGSAASVGVQMTLASGALLTLNANGTYSYDPNNQFHALAVGQTATDSFTYQVSDLAGAVATQTVTLTITGANDAPVAVADTAAAAENGPAVTGNVLANDSDVDAGAVLTVSQVNGSAGNVGVQVTLASGALVTLGANGNYSYNPNGRFETLALGQTTTDSFTYQVRDAQGAVASQTVTVTLTGSNDAPVVTDVTLGAGGSAGLPLVFGGLSSQFAQAVFTFVDATNDGRVDTASSISNLTASGFGNAYGLATGDLDGDGDVDVAVAANGGLFVFTNRGDTNSDGIVEFTGTQVRSGFSGYDIAMGDLNADGRLDLVSVYNTQLFELMNLGDANANGVIDNFSTRTLGAPAASAVYGITVTDLNNDGRADILFANWSQGPVEIRFNLGDTNGDGQIDYRSQSIEDAYDEYGIGVDAGDIDGDGDTDFILSRYSNQDEVVYLNLGDSNGDGLLEFANIVLPTGGNTLESELIDIDRDGDLDVVSNSAQGTPRISYNMGDTNNDGRPDFVVQNLTGPNSNLGLAVGDVDGDGDFDIVLPSQNSGATMVLLNNGDTNGDGRLDFTTFTLAGVIGSWDAEFTSIGTGGAGAAREDGPAVSGAFKGDDIDSDDNIASLTYAITSAPAEGTVVNNNNGTFSFIPGSAFQDLGVGETRTVSFTYRATDAHGAVSNTSTVTIRVAGTNDAPVAVVDSVSTNEDAPVTFNVRANDSDVDGDALNVTHINGVTIAVNGTVSLGTGNGSVRLNADGTLTYTPTANANGARSFTYTVSDGVGGSATSTVNLTINPVNDAPVAAADTGSTDEDTAVTLLGSTLRANDSDIDGAGTFTITSVQATSTKGATVTLNANGDVIYNPAASSVLQALTIGQQTTDTFTYTITDAGGATSTATVTITVAGRLEAPTANPDTVTVTESGTASGDLVINDVVTGSTGASGNVLTNGSFEQGNPVPAGGIAFPASLPGWTSAQGSFEVWGTGFGGNTASDGIAFLELDNGSGIDAYSSTLTTQAGRQYTLQFDLALRNGTAATSNRVEFFVNGVSLGIFTPPSTTFTTFSVTFIGGGSDVITFREPTSDGIGGLIDNLRISAQADVFVTAVGGSAGGVGTAVTGSNGGQFTIGANGAYSFAAGSAFEYLSAGQTATTSVTYTVTDAGGSSTSTVTATVTGQNDAVSITSGPQTAAISEIVEGQAGEDTTVHSHSSVVTFTDVDLADIHSANVAPTTSGYIGSLVMSGVDQAGNSVGWTFQVSDADLEGLAAGEVRTQTYNVTVTDGQGGSAVQTIDITLTGAADSPLRATQMAIVGSANGFQWDVLAGVNYGGSLFSDGISDAYDGAYQVTGFTTAAGFVDIVYTAEGVFLQLGPMMNGAIQLNRSVFIPATGGVARIFDSFTNTGSGPVTIDPTYYTNLGSDGYEPNRTSSSGDAAAGTNDRWFASDDNAGSGDPALLHFTGATDSMVYSSGEFRWSYASITLAAGETRSVLNFAGQHNNIGESATAAGGLMSLDAAELVGLTSAQIATIVNLAGISHAAAGAVATGAAQPASGLFQFFHDAGTVSYTQPYIYSSGGNDFMRGSVFGDNLYAGDGNDTFVGSLGADTYNGGGGADRFVFTDVSQSTSVSMDSINDFNAAEGDVVDVSAIDANSVLAGNQAFTFVASFTGQSGQAVFDSGLLRLDVNGDGQADFVLQVQGAVDTNTGWIL